MENQLQQIGRRIKEARTVLDITVEEMAKLHNLTEAEYLKHENGEVDSTYMFFNRCAKRFNMDLGALITGQSPHLSFYTVTRKGNGMPICRREGFDYLHKAVQMKNRQAEPFLMNARRQDENAPIPLTTHAGQEFDYILKGTLKCQFEDKVEILQPGDSVYYDSGHPHGMIAIGDEDCEFIAVVIKNQDGEILDWTPHTIDQTAVSSSADQSPATERLYKKYLHETVENGLIKDVSFTVPENFNFAYDVIDAIAQKNPLKRAMRWISDKHEVRDFTFTDISRLSQKAANYFTALGVKKGDRVMLILKRHYQFWIALPALHRIGAVAVTATSQLLTKDIVYRFQSAGVKYIVATPDDDIPQCVEEAAAQCPELECKIIVNGDREGWHSFDRDIELYSDVYKRPEDHKVTDPMLLYFSSGTSGYPKMVLHNYSYPIGHIMTARWWQNTHCDDDGLHFTISDTGWAKAAWGKIYGQWLCESAILVYDFRRFQPADILPMFKEHNITTFCAPPTMYRFFIKEDLSKYDFSSVKYAATAGEALNAEVYQQFYNATGLSIMEGFGQTESTLLLGNFIGTTPRPGSMGKPSPQFKIALMDADGNLVPAGEVGEIVIKAERNEVPGLFQGYFRAEDKTAEVWHDGYYHTGDTAWSDEDGYYWYVGRVDDVIKSSGYRIGPFEIESVLMELPYVLECAVTGAPDPVRGQVVKASIVLTKNTVGTEELKKEIQEYVKTHTAPYKYPRIVDFLDELPKTASGKIRRVAIREQSQNK